MKTKKHTKGCLIIGVILLCIIHEISGFGAEHGHYSAKIRSCLSHYQYQKANDILEMIPEADKLHPDLFDQTFHELLWRIENSIALSPKAIGLISQPELPQTFFIILTRAHNNFRLRVEVSILHEVKQALALNKHSVEAWLLLYDVQQELGMDNEATATMAKLNGILKNDHRLIIRKAERMLEKGVPPMAVWDFLRPHCKDHFLALFPILLDLIVLTRQYQDLHLSIQLLETIFTNMPKNHFEIIEEVLVSLHSDLIVNAHPQWIKSLERSYFPPGLEEPLWKIYHLSILDDHGTRRHERILSQIISSSGFLDSRACLLYADLVQRRDKARARLFFQRGLNNKSLTVESHLLAKATFSLARLHSLANAPSREIIPLLRRAIEYENQPSIFYATLYSTLINALIDEPGHGDTIKGYLDRFGKKRPGVDIVLHLLTITKTLPYESVVKLIEPIEVERIVEPELLSYYCQQCNRYGLIREFEKGLGRLRALTHRNESNARYFFSLLRLTGQYEKLYEELVQILTHSNSPGYRKQLQTIATILGYDKTDRPNKSSKRPNIILLTADAFNASRLHYGGYPRPITPNIDGLAKRSLAFDNAFTTANSTAKSGVSFITGRYLFVEGSPTGKNLLNPNLVTIAERMKAEGYHTAAFLENDHLDLGSGFEQGFDHFIDSTDSSLNSEDLLNKFLLMVGSGTLPSPFFVWIHLFSPHGPYRAPYDIVDSVIRMPLPEVASLANEAKPPNGWPTWPIPPFIFDGFHHDTTWYFQRYDADVMYLDRMLKPLFDWIYAYKDTAILFSADHGEALGHHGIFFNHGATLYNEEIKVPCLLHVPWLDIAGKSHLKPVSSIDFVPTLIELAKLTPCNDCSGESLLKQWREGRRVEPCLAYLGNGLTNKVAIIEGEDKVIYDAGQDGNIEDHPMEIYSLGDDPNEKHNLIETRRTRAIEMGRHLKALFEKNPPQRSDIDNASNDRTADTERLDRLKHLGYVE